jgi:hypothetical protein
MTASGKHTLGHVSGSGRSGQGTDEEAYRLDTAQRQLPFVTSVHGPLIRGTPNRAAPIGRAFCRLKRDSLR